MVDSKNQDDREKQCWFYLSILMILFVISGGWLGYAYRDPTINSFFGIFAGIAIGYCVGGIVACLIADTLFPQPQSRM